MNENGEMIYHPPEEDAGEVRIRAMDSDVREGIKKQTSKTVEKIVLNKQTRGMERIQYEDQTPEQKKQEREMFWDYVLQDWRGLVDVEGNEIPCTPENKKLILKKSLPFVWFATRCLQILSGIRADAAEAEIKN